MNPMAFHVMAKPIAGVCNLRCDYCFYQEKHDLFGWKKENFRMSDEVLEMFIRKYIEEQASAEISFVWQGGEPALLGTDFFEKAVRFQKRYSQGKKIRNSIQTNGTRLTDSLCSFLAAHDFLVGLSLDGPEEVHNLYRHQLSGKPSFDETMRGLDRLKKRGVEFNTLTCVTHESSRRPLELYRFLKDSGSRFMQFIPVVERKPSQDMTARHLRLSLPPGSGGGEDQELMPWSVEAEAFGDFLNAIFDEWITTDVGSFFVMNFEWAAGAWSGWPSPVCTFSRQCGRSLVIEHNGDVFACDHYVYPEYRLGNILNGNFSEMVSEASQICFGSSKEEKLPRYCRQCDFLAACNGGCLKHRWQEAPSGEPGWNYLCPGYKKFFRHIDRPMRAIEALVKNGFPAARVMDAVKYPITLPIPNKQGRKSLLIDLKRS